MRQDWVDDANFHFFDVASSRFGGERKGSERIADRDWIDLDSLNEEDRIIPEVPTADMRDSMREAVRIPSVRLLDEGSVVGWIR